MSEKSKWNVRQGNPTCLGTSKTWDGYNFAIQNSEKKSLEIAFYKAKEKEPEQIIQIPEEYRTGEIYAIEVLNPDLSEYEYQYYVDGEPYIDKNARLICGREVFGKKIDSAATVRGKVLQKVNVCPLEGTIPYEEMLVYKVHVRGYTMQKDSGVTAKGTFLGLAEKIPYLKDLGVTTLQLMPVYDYLEYPINKKSKSPVNYWGYTGGFYFAPKAAFSNGKPDVELKQLISELHTAGIECLLEFYFSEDIAPDMALEILRFWRREYKVDGFVLMNAGNWMELFAKDAILADIKIISSNNDIGKLCKDTSRRFGVYNYDYQYTMRRFLNGDENQVEDFFHCVQKNPSIHGMLQFITSHDGFTLADLVSYNWRHNEGNGENNRDGQEFNYSWNCGEEGPTTSRQVLDLRLRQMTNAILLLMLSQGTPVLYGGDEFGNSQNGNNNAYCQDNEIGWVDWSQFEKMKAFTGFVKDVIAFRKRHTILHMPYQLRNSDPDQLGWPQVSYHSAKAWIANTESYSRQAGILYCGAYAKDMAAENNQLIYAAYNMYWAESKLALPDLPEEMDWHVAINSGQSVEEAVFEKGKEIKITEKKSIRMPGRTIIVLIGK